MFKTIFKMDKLLICELKVITLLFLFVLSSNLSLAQNTVNYNNISFSAGIIHFFSNTKKSSSSSKFNSLFNNTTFILQYGYQINRYWSLGSRFTFNKFGIDQAIKKDYSSLSALFAANYRLIRKLNIFIQFDIGPVFYFDKKYEFNFSNSKVGLGMGVSTIYYIRLIENLYTNIEWGLAYENFIPERFSSKSYGFYTFGDIGIAINF